MFFRLIIFTVVAFSSAVGLACASCGCLLSSDPKAPAASAAQGYKIDLRVDEVNQNQLRSGLFPISQLDAAAIVNGTESQEVELYTKNTYITAGFEYTKLENWNLNLQIPMIIREHSTLGTDSDGVTAVAGGGQYKSSNSSLGDVRFLARYYGLLEKKNWGILLGVKIATGVHDLNGDSTDATAPGSVAIDRGLQPGTGTTDGIIGMSYTDLLGKEFDYFVEGVYQSALNESDDYKPGDAFNLNLGFHYLGHEAYTPQVQMNARFAKSDSGANADIVSTGGALVYLSPGLSVPVATDLEIYGFIQLPIYQYLYGVQLAPLMTESLGVRYSF